jgi:hypothetical protein
MLMMIIPRILTQFTFGARRRATGIDGICIVPDGTLIPESLNPAAIDEQPPVNTCTVLLYH